jgi:hypothetical protein
MDLRSPRPGDRRQALCVWSKSETGPFRHFRSQQANQSPSHEHDWWFLMLPTLPFAQALRNAAPKLSRRFLDCRHCQTSTAQLAKTSRSKVLPPIRLKSRLAWTSRRPASTLASPNRVQPLQAHTKQKSSFPETSANSVAYWLLGSAASVFGIVVFGGWTRLTESG